MLQHREIDVREMVFADTISYLDCSMMYRKFNGVWQFLPRRKSPDPIEFPIHS